MAFILVQHLDPDHASALVEILRNSTTMPVSQAETGVVVEADHVFIIPPDAILTIAGGVLNLSRPAAPAARRTSVNTFLMSLAEDQGENAVGIILSGFGNDGALGVAAIKEHGGLTLTQAEFDHAPKVGMPQSAASSGFVDHVLPVEKMPAALIQHWRYRTKTDGAKGPDGVRQDVGDHLGAICAVLNSRIGRDFSQYKTNTLMRRVQRRMQVLQVDDVPTYIAQLRQLPHEPELLFREVLIRVTRFFRDQAAFDALATQSIPAMLDSGASQESLRVWVAGCATGEEAYSLAILFKEAMAHADRPRKVQIFATDLDDQAVEIARAGLYPDAMVADLSAARLERFFVKEGDSYRVSKDIREMCLFSVHDLTKDPPFSRLNLISCRNLLIYFEAALQKRVITTFHYGLASKGVLFLGSSEAVAAHTRMFSPLDKKHRIFERVEAPAQIPTAAASGSKARTFNASPAASDDEIGTRVARLMSHYTPAFVVIDQRQDVRRFSGPIAKFLEPASGTASLNLSSLIHPALRARLRAAIKSCTATNLRVVDEGLTLELAGRREAINLMVEPLNEPGEKGESLFLIAFQELGVVRPAQDVGPSPPVNADANALDELVAARERLQTVTEELETANEELQSSNEEYQSVNEELQSTNEELETSKEELQSINEELNTVNAELNVRNENLVEANSDLVNLIDSTSIATLFLDENLRIKRFTPAVLDIFNVRPGDEGRPITDIVSHLLRYDLRQDVQQVIRTLGAVEREVNLSSSDSTYQMRIRPYRDINNVINGAVVTFVDVSDRKRHEKERANLAAIVGSSEDAIVSHDLDGVITSWNAGAETIYGYAATAAIGRPMVEFLSDEDAGDWPSILVRLRAGETVRNLESTRASGDHLIDISTMLSPIRDSASNIVGVSAVTRDITQRRQADRQAALLLGELDHRVKNILAVVSSVISQTLKTADTPGRFAANIESRIEAIAKAHGLLTQRGVAGTSLGEIVWMELVAFDGSGRVHCAGPDVMLTPKASLALAMTMHELVTNAAKYGALSSSTGRLSVTWEISGDRDRRTLRIDWAESGGPVVAPPKASGFGSVLIERSLAYEFDAVVKQDFLPAGLRCVIDIPLTDEVSDPAGSVIDREAAR